MGAMHSMPSTCTFATGFRKHLERCGHGGLKWCASLSSAQLRIEGQHPRVGRQRARVDPGARQLQLLQRAHAAARPRMASPTCVQLAGACRAAKHAGARQQQRSLWRRSKVGKQVVRIMRVMPCSRYVCRGTAQAAGAGGRRAGAARALT